MRRKLLQSLRRKETTQKTDAMKIYYLPKNILNKFWNRIVIRPKYNYLYINFYIYSEIPHIVGNAQGYCVAHTQFSSHKLIQGNIALNNVIYL